MEKIKTADIIWGEGNLPVAAAFDDPYFCRLDGRAETRHVFIDGNDLVNRWQGGQEITVAELGFGTGLNLLVTWGLHKAICPDKILKFVSFERYPMRPEDMAQALSAYPDEKEALEKLVLADLRSGPNKIVADGLELTLIIGDANDTLAEWQELADAWFLDGFSPAKNPDLWQEKLMREVFNHTKPDGTFATYAAAGWVRRNLQQAGFKVEKARGFGHKRDMLKGCKIND